LTGEGGTHARRWQERGSASRESKKAKEEDQSRFFKLLDNLDTTIVKITGIVVSLGLLIVGCYGSTLSVELNVTSRISGSGQLWVMAAVGVPSGTVYDAKTELNNTTGPQTAIVVLINSAPGSSRYLFVVSASNQVEFNWLKSNQENDGKSGWDINRRDLHGSMRVSNEVLVKTTC
jgi:hypothetical protein